MRILLLTLAIVLAGCTGPADKADSEPQEEEPELENSRALSLNNGSPQPTSSEPIEPSFEHKLFEGRVVCSASAVLIAVAACEILTLGTGIIPSETYFVHDASGAPEFIQLELHWQAEYPTNQKLGVVVGKQGAVSSHRASGGPGLTVLTLDSDEVSNAQIQGNFAIQVMTLFDDTSVVIDQPFKVYSTATYGFSPPDGWTYAEDGELTT